MARGKGRKNESTGKTRMNRQRGVAPTTGRAPGGGGRQANPEQAEERQAVRNRQAEPFQKAPFDRGASQLRKK
jgi:hypothetical protein